MNNLLRLPPIIHTWIEDLKSPYVQPHVKENRILMLEEIVKVCTQEIDKYRIKKIEKTSR